jgi:asparagine synthase (glutamine-hydrolysing)
MMHSLEIRCPFLDYKLAELVYNLPEKYKMDRKNGKIILKDILAEIMPREFVYRRKQGFGAPVKEWLRTEKNKKYVEQTLQKSPQLAKIFKNKKIAQLLDDFYHGKDDDKSQYKIWTLFCLALWFESHEKYHG